MSLIGVQFFAREDTVQLSQLFGWRGYILSFPGCILPARVNLALFDGGVLRFI